MKGTTRSHPPPLLRYLLVAAVTCWRSASLASAEDRPGFPGPGGMGVTTERGLPLEWGGPEDKNVQWKAPASTIVDPDGRFYFASAGKMVVIQAGPELEILAESDLGDPSLATAAVSGGRIFLKGTRFLYAIGNKWASNLEQGLIT